MAGIIVMQETHPQIRELGTLTALLHSHRLGTTPPALEQEGDELCAVRG